MRSSVQGWMMSQLRAPGPGLAGRLTSVVRQMSSTDCLIRVTRPDIEETSHSVVTESRNSWDWKGTLRIIQSNPPDKAGSPRQVLEASRDYGIWKSLQDAIAGENGK